MARRRKDFSRLSRKERRAVLVFSVALLVLIAAVDHFKKIRFEDKPIAVGAVDANDFMRYDSKRFLVIKVVDGDTLDIDEPDGEKFFTRIRLRGVDTPETAKSPGGEMYYGPQASQFAKELAMDRTVTVHLNAGNETRDRYNRLLAYIELPDGRILNEVLLVEGYAYADLRFRHSMYDAYVKLQSEAREKDLGLWGQVAREQLPSWLRKLKPNLLSTN